MKITYRHYRFPKFPATVWECEEFTGRHGTAYHYQRGVSKWEPSPCGGYTLCVVYDDDRSEIAHSVAECSPLDPFDYRLGREIARGRVIKRLFECFGSEFIHRVFLGLGWTKQVELGNFVGEHTRLFNRFVRPDCFFKGSATLPPEWYDDPLADD